MMWTEREGPLALAHRHAPAHMWNVSGAQAHSGGEQRDDTHPDVPEDTCRCVCVCVLVRAVALAYLVARGQ